MKAKVAVSFNIKQEEDGTHVVRNPAGQIVCVCPHSAAAGVLLGWMRLAAWAAEQLAGDQTKLNEVLGVTTPVPEAEAIVRGTSASPLWTPPHTI